MPYGKALVRVGGGGAGMNAPVRIRYCTQVKERGKTRLQGVGQGTTWGGGWSMDQVKKGGISTIT